MLMIILSTIVFFIILYVYFILFKTPLLKFTLDNSVHFGFKI